MMACGVLAAFGLSEEKLKATQESFEAMVRASQSAVGRERNGTRGSVFVLREDLLPSQDLLLLRSAARVLILAGRGSLSEQVIRLRRLRPGPVPPDDGSAILAGFDGRRQIVALAPRDEGPRGRQ